jgi:hypothetical protein
LLFDKELWPTRKSAVVEEVSATSGEPRKRFTETPGTSIATGILKSVVKVAYRVCRKHRGRNLLERTMNTRHFVLTLDGGIREFTAELMFAMAEREDELRVTLGLDGSHDLVDYVDPGHTGGLEPDVR